MLGYMNENTIVGEERVGAKKFFSLEALAHFLLTTHSTTHNTAKAAACALQPIG